MRTVVAQLPVLAAERDDPRFGGLARGERETVGLQPRAHDDPVGLERRPVREVDRRAMAVLPDTANPGARPDLAAGGGHLGGEGTRDRGEIGDCRLGGVERGDAPHMRLDRAQLARLEPLQPRHAVRGRPLLEAAERLHLMLVGRDHELAAGVEGQPVLGAVVAQ